MFPACSLQKHKAERISPEVKNRRSEARQARKKALSNNGITIARPFAIDAYTAHCTQSIHLMLLLAGSRIVPRPLSSSVTCQNTADLTLAGASSSIFSNFQTSFLDFVVFI